MLETTLPNGFELIIQPTSSPVAALQVWVDVGSLDETPTEAGYCHFLEHMLFKGTKKRTTSEIAGTVEGSGGDMNAFTSFEYTAYHITLANNRWKIANEILADMVLGSVFKDSEFKPEKDVILEEIKRSDDSPDRQAYRGLYSLMYGKTGYGKPVIGFPKTVSGCTAARLKSFWKRTYTPGMMTMVICGDVNAAEVLKEVQRTWGKATGKPIRPRRREISKAQGVLKNMDVAPLRSKSIQSKEFPLQSVRWVGAMPACSFRSHELPALDLSAMVLGQGEGSRLYQSLLRDKEIVTSISAGVWSPAVARGMYTFDAEIPVDCAKNFRKAFGAEVERFCQAGPNGGPTKDELERVKMSVEVDRVYGMQSMESLAHRLAYLKIVADNPRFDLEYNATVRELSREDLRDAAKKYLSAEPMREFALVPKGFDASQLWGESAPLGGKTTSVKRASVTKKTEVTEEKIDLGNGVEIILCPRPDLPIMSVQAMGLGGLRMETEETSGISNLLFEVVEQGPRGWTAPKFVEFLESTGSHIEGFTGRNSAGLSGMMLTRKIEEVLPIFLETYFDPALDSEEVRRAQTLALEEIKTFEDDSARLAGRAFSENLFENHPYGRPILGTLDSVKNISHDLVVRQYQQYLEQKRLVFVVSGKFNSNVVTNLISDRLKNMKREIRQDWSKVIPYTRLKAPRLIEIPKNREQSHIIIGFEGTSLADPRRFDLKLLLTVMGGQSGCLFREVRDKKGLCYTVSPISFEGLEAGYLGVYIGCDPGKRHLAIDAIWAELKKLQSKPIEKAELARSVEYLLGRHHMEMQQISSVCSTVGFSSLYGLGFDEYKKFESRLRKVTQKSIQNYAQDIFSRPSVTSIVV